MDTVNAGTETAIGKLRVVAGSVVLSIPRRVLESAGMKSGDRVVVKADRDTGTITIEK